MAFLIAFARYIINGDSTSNLTIWGYTPNTNSVGTNLLGLVVLLMALNAIYSAISLLILHQQIVGVPRSWQDFDFPDRPDRPDGS